MADPLSVAVSVAGLVTLAETVFSKIYKYAKAISSASKDIARLTSEIGALYGILSNLRLIAEQLESETYQSTFRAHHIDSCYQTLEKVRSILERDKSASSQDRRLKTMKHKLQWPFTSSEIKDLIVEIERHKSVLGLALNADGVLNLRRALSKQDNIKESVDDLRNEFKLRREAETRIAISKQRQKVLSSFSGIDFQKNHDMNRKLRQPGTGLWLTENPEFKDWLDTKCGRLWLYGIPGSGKTILTSLLIDEMLLKSSPSIAVAYFYCDYKDIRSQELSMILGCLVQQIARQNEQSFIKAQDFHENHGQGRRDPVDYDSLYLCHLIVDMAKNYDYVIIIVDGLDECGMNAGLVAEVLASLNNDVEGPDLKSILLSRDEVDICQCLQGFSRISVAANSSDLKLYVGAEIENRTRKKRLNIKSSELKELVMDRLIQGAEGIQIDYLCELPNDAARRKALNDLPHGLRLTYERLLRRINESNEDRQRLVQRTLRWIARGRGYPRLTAEGLCEAISIELASLKVDREAIPEKTEILRSCSSFIRMSADGKRFEFAHFTVEEFLNSIDKGDQDFAAYSIGPNSVHNELATVCLTYLNLEEFDQGGDASEKVTFNRFAQYPFREYAVLCWLELVERSNKGDGHLFSLTTKLLHPSKPGILISWAQDLVPFWSSRVQRYSYRVESHNYIDRDALATVNCGLSEATALHYAAMGTCSGACRWLIENKCDVNRDTAFGTPLHCALLKFDAFNRSFVISPLGLGAYDNFRKAKGVGSYDSSHEELKVINLLLEAGAKPDMMYDGVKGRLSTLFIAVCCCSRDVVCLLLQKGAIVDDHFVNLFIEQQKANKGPDDLQYILEHAKHVELGNESRARALEFCLRAKRPSIEGLFLKQDGPDKDDNGQKIANEALLRMAAEFGQTEAVVRLLDNHGVDIHAREQGSLLNALHYALIKDQVETVQILLERGASPSQTDRLGKTSLQHCVENGGYRCLPLLFQEHRHATISPKEMLTALQAAISKHNTEALKSLLSWLKVEILTNQSVMKQGSSLISCASKVGSVKAVRLLLDAGLSATDVDEDGCIALHHAANAGSPEVVQLLIAQGSDCNQVSNDGSSVIHYAYMGDNARIDEVADALLADAVNPFTARGDGIMPVQLLIREGNDSAINIAKEKCLRRLASLPGTFQGKQESLELGLAAICQLRPSKESAWLLNGFKILLKAGASLTSISGTGKMSFAILSDMWRDISSKSKILGDKEQGRRGTSYSSFTMSTEMMLIALEHIPSQGPLHDFCAAPDLLLSAIEISNDQVIAKLLDHSPDVDQTIGNGNDSPIKFACRNGCQRSLLGTLLKRSRALFDKALGSELVREACQQGHKQNHEALLELLEAGLDPNYPNTQGENALMFAARAGNVDMVKLLLSHGGDTRSLDHSGCNAAHYACISGRASILRALRYMDLDCNAKANTVVNGQYREAITILHLAAASKTHSVLQYILDENLMQNIDALTNLDETALFMAAWCGRSRNVSLLLSKNADPTRMADTTEGKCSSMHIAAECGHWNVLVDFIKHGCDLRILDSQGLDCEMKAWKHGHTGLAKMIGEHNQKQNHGGNSRPSAGVSQTCETASEPLMIAINLGNLDLCKKIVQEGLELDAECQYCDGCTPLLYCIYRNQPLIAEFLASKGASPHGRKCRVHDPVGYSGFHHAARLNYHELLRTLLDHHQSQYHNLADPVHPLHLAIISEATECVDLILRKPEISRSSILLALSIIQTAYGHQKGTLNPASWPKSSTTSAYRLPNLRLNGPSDQRLPAQIWNSTPLKIAASTGNIQIAGRLLKAGARVDAGGLLHETPLHVAATRGDVRMSELLLESGANPSARDNYLMTPAMLAAKGGHLETLKALSNDRADISVLDHSGRNILHHAAESGRLEVLSYLLTTMDTYDLFGDDKCGASVLRAAFLNFNGHESSILLNLAFSPEAYYDFGTENILSAAVRNPKITRTVFKMLLRKVPRDLLPKLLGQRDAYGSTPLHAASTMASIPLQQSMIDLLLDAGADLEIDGGDCRTPLMSACAVGRLPAVQHLVKKGAKMIYTKDGQTFSALDVANKFPDIVRWLLVGRHVEGPALLTNGGTA